MGGCIVNQYLSTVCQKKSGEIVRKVESGKKEYPNLIWKNI